MEVLGFVIIESRTRTESPSHRGGACDDEILEVEVDLVVAVEEDEG